MSDEKRGVDLLRETIETVAVELESRRRPDARPTWRRGALLAAAAAMAAVAVGVWALRPAATVEVEILDLRIQGRPVTGIVLDDPAAASLIVRPQIGGRPLASFAPEGEMR